MNISRIHAQLHAVSALGTTLSGAGAPRTDVSTKTPNAPGDAANQPVGRGTGPAVVNRVDPTTVARASTGPQRDDSPTDFDESASAETDSHDEREAKADAAKVRELKARDAEVRAHEQAHAAAGGGHTGSPSYETEIGPDGQSYAVSGEVAVDVSAVAGDPEATLAKMQQVKRAALAPASPSGADRAVASKAAAQAAAAAREIAQKRTDANEAAAATSGPKDAIANATASSTDAPQVEGVRRAAQNAYAPPAAPSLGSMVNLQSCGKCGGAHQM